MSKTPASVPELLSPAGGHEALRAAVANGADAVYLGVERLNARRGARNFTLDDLERVCTFAHLRGVRVYLTANVVVLPHEMAGALDLIDRAWASGVDAVIVQDLGLLRCIRETLPGVRVHASTQVNTHAPSTLKVLATRGCSRITLARETALGEIASLAAAGRSCGVEVESFVHGALCVCYSGQCLLSSLIGGRSANRGQCAQPCRMTYRLVGDSGPVDTVAGEHLLSPKDLAGVHHLPELVRAGVGSLKIEGRMKSAEYVALVTSVYRAALDRAAGSADFAVREGEDAVLSEAFSRGLSPAYLVGERGNAMMSYQRPNNRGIPVGRIVALKGRVATLALEAALDAADTIEVWTSRGRFAQEAGALGIGGSPQAAAPYGARVEIELQDHAAVGDRVFRVRNAALAQAAARTFESADDSAPVAVDFRVRVVTGEPAQVTAVDGEGRTGTGTGETVAQARTRAVTAEDLIEHVGRLGGSGFEAHSFDVALSPGAGIGFSELHRLRREALADLERAVIEPWADRSVRGAAPPALDRRASGRAVVPVRLVVVAGSERAARACLGAGADEVHLDHRVLRERAPGLVPLLPRICHEHEEPRTLAAVHEGHPAVAATLGTLVASVAAGADVEAHWSLNATNAHTVAELAELGASFVWLSPELSRDQITAVAAHATVPVGISVMGSQEVMVTEHCILMAEGECDRDCARCPRRRSGKWLLDRKGYRFPVRTDPSGRSHVYNSVPLDLLASIDEVLETGVAAVRLDLELLTAEDAAAQTRRARAALDSGSARVSGRAVGARTTTSGHFFRGVG